MMEGKAKPSLQQAQLHIRLLAGGFLLLLVWLALLSFSGKGGPEVQQAAALVSATPAPALAAQDVSVAWFCTRPLSATDAREAFLAHRREWEKMGKMSPWHSVLSVKELEGREVIPPEEVDKFYASGVGSMELYRGLMKKIGRRLGGRAVDFGCGLGRLTQAMAPIFDSVTGVDQSPPHLAIAREQAELRGVKNVRFVQREWNLLEGAELQAGQFDFVGSLIVLQHMVPPLMEGYIVQFCELLRPGGTMIFHLPTYITDYRWECDVSKSIAAGGMQMHALPQFVIIDILAQRGCKVLEFVERDYIGIPGSSSSVVVAIKPEIL